jgi:hypothetical protein
VDFFDAPSVIVKDNADRIALSRLGGSLERTLVEPFTPEYNDMTASARKRLIEAWGSSNVAD